MGILKSRIVELIGYLSVLALTMPFPALAEDAVVDAERARAESQLSDSKSKIAEFEKKIEEDYRDNPRSERAHMVYSQLMISKGRDDDAAVAIARLKALNPKAKVAAVLEQYQPKCKAAVTAVERTHLEANLARELSTASVADVQASMGTDAPVQLGGKDFNELMRDAEISNDKRRAEIRRRFPDVCAVQPTPAEVEAEAKVTAEVIQLQHRKGEDGLAAEFPKLLEKYPGLPSVRMSYIQFLLRERRFDEATKAAAAAAARFPKSPELHLLDLGLKEIAKMGSDELRKGRTLQIGLELMDLSTVRVNCLGLPEGTRVTVKDRSR